MTGLNKNRFPELLFSPAINRRDTQTARLYAFFCAITVIDILRFNKSGTGGCASRA